MRLQSISSSDAESRLHGVQCKFYQSYDIFWIAFFAISIWLFWRADFSREGT